MTNKNKKMVKKTPPKFKLKKKVKGIDSYVLKGESCRKVLNAKDLQPCETKKCQFFKDMCQPCKDCGSQSKIVNIRCKTCFDCENTPDSVRFEVKNESKNKGDKPDNQIDEYKQAEEELALKAELMALMMKIQDMQNRNKDKNKGKKGDKEIKEQYSVPSYLG